MKKSLKVSALVAALLSSPLAFAALSDGEIAKIVQDANQTEISSAQTALNKSTRSDVKSFAKKMLKEHQSNRQEVEKIARKEKIEFGSSVGDLGLRTKSATHDVELSAKSGADFDRAYIESQISAHRDLLDDLDTKLIPEARNSSLKKFLEDTRGDVKDHLDEAEKIQAKLTK
jgi:putative membrane protein